MRTRPKPENNYNKLKRDAMILKLREQGLTYRQISAEIREKFPNQAGGKDIVAKVIKDAAKEAREEMSRSAHLIVVKELRDLDEIEKKYLKNIRDLDIPDNKDVEMVLKIKERRSRYLGLDAPAKSAIHTSGDTTVKVVDFSKAVEDDKVKAVGEVLK